MRPDGRAWLGLGSNLGDRAATIGAALRTLRDTPDIVVTAASGLYRSPPWGDPDQGEFLNGAAAIRTALPPHDLLAACQAIEDRFGRVRTRRWGPRILDVDILAYEGVALDDGRLTLPHPLWRERAFVLVPLAEIAPDLCVDGTRIADALAALGPHDVRPLVP